MKISNPPDAPAADAADPEMPGPAADVDHVWFEKNAGRVHRLRDLVPFESFDPLGVPPLGMSWRILVTRVPGGGRLRLPVALPRELPNDAMDDIQLSQLFDRLAPPDAMKICRHVLPHKH
ncbi:hypothetical protein [Bradyrhizobium sp. 2TAF24]|uniref:hypothetical protein n=1 Tax=Bradyrhizobium sp. 2TAF24 TaxID=3233011 RepID=UPI003F8FA178